MMKWYVTIAFLLVCFLSYSQQQIQALHSGKVLAPGKEDFSDDWANLIKYQQENKALATPKQGENRVVFLGSSIFENWKKLSPEFFTNQLYIDRGISGQISPQLLIRFRQDVINLKPKVVVILAGSNDIAGNTGHTTYESIMDNIISMAELAKANKIQVVLCKYLPVFKYPWKKGIKPAQKIIALNKLIEKYSLKNNIVLLDYFTPFANAENGQKAELTLDGVHPNAAGYKIMEKATEEAIRKVLKQKNK